MERPWNSSWCNVVFSVCVIYWVGVVKDQAIVFANYREVIMKKEMEFEGFASGDHESFCWDVGRDTFTRITGRKPEKYDKSLFNKGLYRVYPNDVLVMGEGRQRFIITSEVEDVM